MTNIVFAFSLCLLSAQAQFSYITNNGAITITGYTCPGGDVTIPANINGLPVTGIGGYAFFECTSLTSVTIPDPVTSIAIEAFYGCTGLTNVTIGNGVASIGYFAFSHCSSLTSVAIGNGVTYIDYDAFSYCTSLTSVTIPDSVTTIGGVAFAACASLTNVTIGKAVTSIGFEAFGFCPLTSITIPDSVTSIGDDAFFDCNLTTITIGSGVTNIGHNAFWGCTRLAWFTVDATNSVYSSVAGVLFNKSQTTLIQYPERKVGCDYTILNTVTTIGDYALYSCTNLTSITIPNSVTSIGNYAFDSCSSLTNVRIGSSVTSIGGRAFSFCPYLTSVTLPNSVTSIGGGAFECCTRLIRLAIGNSVTNIGGSAFYECTSLTSVTAPDTVAIPNSVTIPDSVTSIGDAAFYGCPNLTHITVGKGIITIGSSALACTALPSGILPVQMSVCFTGNAPTNVAGDAFAAYVYDLGDGFLIPCLITVYYFPGTTGWAPTLGGRPTVCWDARITNAKKTAKGFSGFITGNTNLNTCIYASTNLANQNWQRIRASVSLAGGPAYFEDNDSTNQTKFYKLGWSMPWNCVQTQIDDDNLHGGYAILSVNITPAAGNMLLAYVHSRYDTEELWDGTNTWLKIGTVVCSRAAPDPPGTNSAGNLSLYYVPSCAGETVRIATPWPAYSLQVFEFSGGPWVLKSWSHASEGYWTCCPPIGLICPLTVISNGLDVAAIACLKGPCSPGCGWTSPGDFQGLVEWRKSIPNPNGYAEIINAADSDDYGAISASFIQQ